MSQRSISSFFQAKPESAGKVSAEKTKVNGGSPPSKENVTPNKSVIIKECSGSIEKSEGAANTLDSLPETNLDAPVPYRKTAPKLGKRSSDENCLQAQAPKKIKLETENESSQKKEKSPEKVKKESPKTTTKSPKVEKEKKSNKSTKEVKSMKDEEKILVNNEASEKSSKEVEVESSIKEESNSPVKVSRSNKNRIISDSEDDSPVKAKPESTTQAKQTFSIFAAAKSPVKKPKVEEESPKKSPVKKSPPKSKEKVSAKKTSPKEKSPKSSNATKEMSPIKTEEKSPKLEKESPKPSTSKAESQATTNTPKPKNPFQGFFSPKQAGGVKKDSAAGNDYDKMVKKLQYHPVDDAFWKKSEKTPYLALAKTLVAIEETSGRLRTIEILSNFFRSVMVLNPEDLVASVYMITNRLAPAWKGIELGVGESFLIKAIGNSTGRNPKQIKEDMLKLGDLGLVAESSKSSQKTMFQPKPLTLGVVFDRLKEVALMTGTGGTNKKVDKIQQLMVACQGPEARYLIRTLANKLRIGLAEQSVLQALTHACVQTPIGQEFPPKIHTAFKSAESDAFKEKLSAEALKLKTAYCECPTYDLLIPALLEEGIDGLKTRCKLTTGIPLKPMLAHPTKGIQEVLTRFENCKFTCEWKYDGERAQIHLNQDGSINIYSRNQEDNTSKYPDIISRIKNCFKGEVNSFILDCEAVAWDPENKAIKPFQVLSTRKRKDAVESEIKVQVCVFAFDLLYLNGESMVRKNFGERRDLLRENFKEIEGEFFYAKSIDGTTIEEIQEALDVSIKENCEGLMVKTLDHEATYEIARRSHNWLKVKKDYLEGVGDTLDLVVIGGYNGKGKRTGGYGGFLLACYDPENEEYQTICKIGTGFSDEDLQKHAAFFKENVIPQAKGYYSYDPSHAPDQWFEPVQVWEVKCADLSVSPVHKAAMGLVDPSKGVSLRFPRFIRIRDDKSPEAATSSDQIADMYNNQDQIKNQIKNNQKSTEDDFDF